ncbi:hypothetical protein ACFV83_04625 [Streptomyces pharetrae]|uniref:hypothetical protein n=1 Tax=Streptomyces pharetrae TaxID=291370 RepID=UPI003663394A
MPHLLPVDPTVPLLITRIEVRVQTGASDTAGTDGWVYLGIGGREFQLDTPADDFRRPDPPTNVDTFILGDGANVNNAGDNDPRSPQLRVADLDRYSAYLSFEPADDNDNWEIDWVNVTLTAAGGGVTRFYDYHSPVVTDGSGPKRTLWLGTYAGTQLSLASVS